MKNRIINGNPLEFFNSSNEKKGEIKISGSDIIINPLDSSGTVIFGEEGTINDIEIGGTGTPVDFTFLGGGTIAANGNTITIGNSGDTIDLSNATIGTITASIFKGGVFEGDGSSLTNLPSAFTHVTASGNISASGMGTFAQVRIGESTTTNYGLIVDYPDTRLLQLKRGGSVKFKVIADNADGQVDIYDNSGNSDIRFLADGDSYITNNLGIGTTSPASELDVNGTITLAGDTEHQILRHTLSTHGLSSGQTTSVFGRNVFLNAYDDVILRAGSSDEIRMFAGDDSTARMTIDQNGNVGIGTSSPSSPLHVSGSTTPKVIIEGDDGAQLLRLRRTDANAHFDISLEGNDLRFNPNTLNNSMNVLFGVSNGSAKVASRVGIGQPVPQSELDVSGSVIVSGHLETDQIYLGDKILHSGDTDTYIAFEDNTHRYFAEGEEMIKFNSSKVTINEAAGNNDLQVKGNTDDNLLYTDGSADKVGIGTNTPGEKLEVDGSVKIGNMKLQNSGGGRIGFNRNTANGSIYDSSISAYQIQNNTGDFEIQSYTGAGGYLGSVFVISGSIGIGTNTPGEKLEVNGNILADSYKISNVTVLAGSTNVALGSSGATGTISLNTHGGTIFKIDGNDNILIRTGSASVVGGTARMTVDVGSGTSSPISIVNGTTDGMYIRRYGSSGKYQIQTTVGGGNSGVFSLQTYGGNVGIGTTTAPEKLTVEGNISASGTVTANSLVGTLTGTATGLSGTPDITVGAISATSITTVNITSSFITSSTIQTSGSNVFGDESTDTHTFIGNVTASGNISASGHISSSGLYIESSTITDFIKLNSLSSNANPIKLIFEKAASEQGIIEYNRNGDLEIYNTDGDGGVMIDGSTSAGGDLYVANSGKVGIGTTSPEKELTVNGSIQIPNNQQITFTDIGDGKTGRVKIVGNEDDDFIRMHVDNSNSHVLALTTTGVGIGNLTPSEKLTVEGDISASGDLILEGGVTASTNIHVGEYIYHDGDLTNYHRFLANRQIFVVGNASSIDLNNGVSTFGATSAATTLQGSTLTLDSAGDIDLDADGADIILKDGGTEFGRFKRDSSNFVIKSATNDKDIIFRGVDNSSTITAMTIDMSAAGRVAIGSHGPSRLLHVSGSDSDASILLEKSTNDALIETKTNAAGAYFRANSAGSSNYYGLELNNDTTGNWFLGSYGYADFSIVDGAKSSGTRQFTVKNTTGNVGIGTTAPPEKLTVEGNISASGELTIGGDLNLDLGDNIRFGNQLAIIKESNGELKLYGGTNGTDGGFELFTWNGSSYESAFTLKNDKSATFVGAVTSSNGLAIKGTAPYIRLQDTRNLNNPDWDGVSLGNIEFYSSDTTSPGARVLSEIEAFSNNSAASGPNSELRFKTSQITDSSPQTRLTIAHDGTSEFSGNLTANNLSGTNTGDQDLSSYATLTNLNASSSTLQSNIDGKQATLTFGKSSGNALKSEEALTTNDILLMGSSHVKGRTYAELKTDLSLNNVENTAISTFAGSSNITTVGTLGSVTVTGNITANGNIVGDNGTNVTGINAIEVSDGIANTTDNTTKIAISSNGHEFLVADDTVFELGAAKATLSKRLESTEITASGNISSSGTITANVLTANAITFPQDTNITIETPDEDEGNGFGGNLTIGAGNGAGSNGNGGNITIETGNGSGAGDGGDLTLTAGTGNPDGAIIMSSTNFNVDATGNVTASGEIEASGEVYSDNIETFWTSFNVDGDANFATSVYGPNTQGINYYFWNKNWTSTTADGGNPTGDHVHRTEINSGWYVPYKIRIVELAGGLHDGGASATSDCEVGLWNTAASFKSSDLDSNTATTKEFIVSGSVTLNGNRWKHYSQTCDVVLEEGQYVLPRIRMGSNITNLRGQFTIKYKRVK